ncbi:YbjN domain-containing protein [Brevundimonas sp.]|uniref:YbjN domain-containing protein n=1 Tax=Brevundimonas sp. TaxID=1871086 RepID=UPI001DCC408D|nr:YbjN domain-containing protein [Brevundimonas sp.]MBL0948310.1 YbjN domain-containing protein [Brevundimonas sp.]
MRYVIAAMLAVFSLGMAVPAEAQSRRGTEEVYFALTHADLQTVLSRQGYDELKQVEPGIFNITVEGGFKMTVEQRVCDEEGQPEGCLGLSIMASWGYSPEQRPTLEELANTFNGQYSIAKVIVFDEAIAIERYVITDGGVTLEHVSRELNEFLNISDVLVERMIEALGL